VFASDLLQIFLPVLNKLENKLYIQEVTHTSSIRYITDPSAFTLIKYCLLIVYFSIYQYFS